MKRFFDVPIKRSDFASGHLLFLACGDIFSESL